MANITDTIRKHPTRVNAPIMSKLGFRVTFASFTCCFLGRYILGKHRRPMMNTKKPKDPRRRGIVLHPNEESHIIPPKVGAIAVEIDLMTVVNPIALRS